MSNSDMSDQSKISLHVSTTSSSERGKPKKKANKVSQAAPYISADERLVAMLEQQKRDKMRETLLQHHSGNATAADIHTAPVTRYFPSYLWLRRVHLKSLGLISDHRRCQITHDLCSLPCGMTSAAWLGVNSKPAEGI